MAGVAQGEAVIRKAVTPMRLVGVRRFRYVSGMQTIDDTLYDRDFHTWTKAQAAALRRAAE